MKTAEETLKKHLTNYGTPVYHRFFHEDIVKAMKEYAKSMIEADRKDAAARVANVLGLEGIYGFEHAVKSSITDRPLPELK